MPTLAAERGRPFDPVLAIATTLVLSLSLLSAHPIVVLVLGAAMLPVILPDDGVLHRALRLGFRLKWFYLSLLILFGWMPPDASGGLQLWPSPAGLAEAGLRIGALWVLVAWIAWCMQAFSRRELIDGLETGLRPLRGLGLPDGGFARRLFLAIAYFEEQRTCEPAPRLQGSGRRSARWWSAREWVVSRIAWALSAPSEPAECPAGTVTDPGSARTGAGAAGPIGEAPGRARVAILAWMALAIVVALAAQLYGVQWPGFPETLGVSGDQ